MVSDSPRPSGGLRRFSSLRVVQRSHSAWDIHNNSGHNRKRSLQVSAASSNGQARQMQEDPSPLLANEETKGLSIGMNEWQMLIAFVH